MTLFPSARMVTDTVAPDCDVDLWYANLDPSPGQVDAFFALLSPEEQGRAQRFMRPRDARRFTVAHGFLRTVLGLYLDTPADRLQFQYQEKDKPALVTGHRPLHFNLSHSEELVVIAVSLHFEIGVDIEFLRPMPDAMQIARQFFSAAEVAALERLPQDQKEVGFFTCWTRKEAYLKAVGAGLHTPLDSFTVSLSPNEPARLLSVREAPEEAEKWSLLPLQPSNAYIGTLAVRNEQRLRIRTNQLECPEE